MKRMHSPYRDKSSFALIYVTIRMLFFYISTTDRGTQESTAGFEWDTICVGCNGRFEAEKQHLIQQQPSIELVKMCMQFLSCPVNNLAMCKYMHIHTRIQMVSLV